MLGWVPLWAPGSATLWSSAAQGMDPGLLHGHWEQHIPGSERAAGRRWQLWNPREHLPERTEIYFCGRPKLQKDRLGNGEFLGVVLACNLLVSKTSSRSHGRERFIAGVISVSQPPNWNPVNKTCFLQHKLSGNILGQHAVAQLQLYDTRQVTQQLRPIVEY